MWDYIQWLTKYSRDISNYHNIPPLTLSNAQFMQQAHNFKRNLFILKIVGNTFPTHSFFPNTFLFPPQKMPERLLGVLCKHLSQWNFPQRRSFWACAVPGHTAPSFPCSPDRDASWLPAWEGCSQCQPPGPEPSCCPTDPPWGSPIGCHTHGSKEKGHREGCCTESNLYAAISKNLRFSTNAPLAAEIESQKHRMLWIGRDL